MIGLWRYGGDFFGCDVDGSSAVFLWGEVEELYYDEDESYLLVVMYFTLKRRPSRYPSTFSYPTCIHYSYRQ